MFNLKSIFESKADKVALSKKEIAEFLKTDSETLQQFEESYRNHVLKDDMLSDNFFEINAKQIAKERKKYFLSDITSERKDYDAIIQRIVSELLEQATVYNWDGKQGWIETFDILPDDYQDVTLDDLLEIPEAYRPDLTGTLYKNDIAEDTSSALLYEYKMYLENTNPKIKQQFYNMFRQGLDILDLDPLTYKIIDRNQNSMGYWLPALADAVKNQDFFKIPATKILKVPLSLLQLTRQEYTTLTPATMRIVDEFCYKVFGLDQIRNTSSKQALFPVNMISGMPMWWERKKSMNWENIFFSSITRPCATHIMTLAAEINQSCTGCLLQQNG